MELFLLLLLFFVVIVIFNWNSRRINNTSKFNKEGYKNENTEFVDMDDNNYSDYQSTNEESVVDSTYHEINTPNTIEEVDTETNQHCEEINKTRSSKLIKCPMCDKEISPNARMCPNCGEPMEDRKTNKIKFPKITQDLDVGIQLESLLDDTDFFGYYENYGGDTDIPDGKIHILLCEYGIRMCRDYNRKIMDIHNSLIESIEEISEIELENKSVVGRAVLGGVLLGGVGAIIGGMSALTPNTVRKYYLIINYWDIKTKELMSISIGCDTSSKEFIQRFNMQKSY